MINKLFTMHPLQGRKKKENRIHHFCLPMASNRGFHLSPKIHVSNTLPKCFTKKHTKIKNKMKQKCILQADESIFDHVSIFWLSASSFGLLPSGR
uniref:Uncharacterized protein n=1 Tax=Nelumbo nucifera TaxID=4432 RepID=A0A822XIE5_NELNU|nr:TPA_asm: hypothetical protein HUJ06_020374 [Nelumbo nucifera]